MGCISFLVNIMKKISVLLLFLCLHFVFYADAQIVSTYVDGVILVSKSGVTSSKDLNEAIETLEHSNGNLCGIVVNNIKDKKTSFFNFNRAKIG